MQTITLEGTKDEMPMVGYGTWDAKGEQVYKGVRAAIKFGYRHLDCAWCYNNEIDVGRAIADELRAGTVKRENLFVTSKLWNCCHRPARVHAACLESLRALGLDHLDLYLIHFPVSFKEGVREPLSADEMDNVDPLETWKAMEQLVDEGLVKNIGVSNHEVADLKTILDGKPSKPIATNQIELHPYYQRKELIQFCHEHKIAITAHSSMGGPNNPMSAFHKQAPPFEDRVILDIAEKHGTTPRAVLLRWGLQIPAAVLPKSVHEDRIRANLECVSTFKLDDDDLRRIAHLDKPGIDGCVVHPCTPWLGRSSFTGEMKHYMGYRDKTGGATAGKEAGGHAA